VRSRLHAAAARGLTRFIGRDGEMEQLRQALTRARTGPRRARPLNRQSIFASISGHRFSRWPCCRESLAISRRQNASLENLMTSGGSVGSRLGSHASRGSAASRPGPFVCLATLPYIVAIKMRLLPKVITARRWLLASQIGMRLLMAHCHLGLGKLYRRTIKHEQRVEHLTTAASMYREMSMQSWLEEAETEMRQLLR
jgi:hypothetical protein